MDHRDHAQVTVAMPSVSTYRGVRSLKLHKNEAKKTATAATDRNLIIADNDVHQETSRSSHSNKVESKLSSTRFVNGASTFKVSDVSGRSARDRDPRTASGNTPVTETPRTLYEKLYQEKVASQTSLSVQSSLVSTDPTAQRSRYLEFAGLPRQSQSVDSFHPEDSSESTPRRSRDQRQKTTSTTSTMTSCEDIRVDSDFSYDGRGHGLSHGLSPARSVISPCSSPLPLPLPLPVIRRQMSTTFLELESVSRTNIVSTVRQLFEKKSTPSTDNNIQQRVGRRSKSALGIVTPPNQSSSMGATEDSGNCGDKERLLRLVDLGSSRQPPESKPRSSSISGVSSSSGHTSHRGGCLGNEVFDARDLEGREVDKMTTTFSWLVSTSPKNDNKFNKDYRRNNDNDDDVRNNKMVELSEPGDFRLKSLMNENDCLYGITSQMESQAIVKRGWLLKQTTEQIWEKQWCVLRNHSLVCYCDQKAERTPDPLHPAEKILFDRVALVNDKTSIRAVVNLVDIRGQIAFIVNSVDRRQHVFSAMTSGIRASWMRAILNCVNQDSPPTSGIQCEVVSSSTPTSSRQLVSSCDDQFQRFTMDPNRRLSMPSSSLVSRDSVAPIAAQSSSPVHQPTATSRWSPSPASAPPPPGRLVAVTAAAKLSASSGDVRTKSSVGIRHPTTPQLQQQQQSSFNANNQPLDCLDDRSCSAARVVRGRATTRRTRPVPLAEDNELDCVPQSIGQPFTRVGAGLVVSAKAFASKPASGSESTEVLSSDTVSTSDSEDSTLWTHHFSGVGQHRGQSRDQTRLPIDVSRLRDNGSTLAKVESRPSRESRRRGEKRPLSPLISASLRPSIEYSNVEGQSAVTNSAELSGTTKLTTSHVTRPRLHLPQQSQAASDKREIENRRPTNHQRAFPTSSHVTTISSQDGGSATDDEKHLMINALTKLLAMKTERLERLEKMTTDSEEELCRLRKQIAEQSRGQGHCDRCRCLLKSNTNENPGSLVDSLKQDLVEKVTIIERLKTELSGSRDTFINELDRERRLHVKVMSDKDEEHRQALVSERRRLAEEMERRSKMMTDIIKEKEENISELEDRTTNDEKLRRTIGEQMSEKVEECRMRQEDSERMNIVIDNYKSELDIERQRAAALSEDVRHLRLEQMNQTALRIAQTKNTLLGEDLERVEVKMKQLQETGNALEANLETSQRNVNLLREQLESAKIDVEEWTTRATSAEMKVGHLQSTNDELKLHIEELENLVRTFRDKVESEIKESDNERTRRRTAERKVTSLQDKNTKLIETNQLLKVQCAELQENIAASDVLTKTVTDDGDKMAALVEANVRLNADITAFKSEAANLRDELNYSAVEMAKLRREYNDEKSINADKHDAELTALKNELSRLRLEEHSDLSTKKSSSDVRDDVPQSATDFESPEVVHQSLTDDSAGSAIIYHCDGCELCPISKVNCSKCNDKSGGERKLNKSNFGLGIAEQRQLKELEETNAELRRQLRDAEIDRERVMSELSATNRGLVAKLEAAERRNRRLTLQQQSQQQQQQQQHQTQDPNDEVITAMEQSYQRQLVELQRSHKEELEELRHEKDELLKDEAKATQAVLDAMQKVHEAALEKERKKFFDLISKTYCQADIESLRQQHEEDLELIQREIDQLSEQYCVKCIQNTALLERISTQAKIIENYQTQFTELSTRNEVLNGNLKTDLSRLSSFIETSDDGRHETSDDNQCNMALQVAQSQLIQVQQELASMRCQLDIKSEELRDARATCERLYVRLLENRVKCNESTAAPSGDKITNDEIHVENDNSALSVDEINQLLLTSVHANIQRTGARRRSSGRSNWRLKNPQRAHTSPDVAVTSLAVSASPSPSTETSVPVDHVTESNLSVSPRPDSLACEMVSTAF